MNYITVICDLVASRQLDNREEIQYKLIDTLKEANKRYSMDIVAPFVITIGDEWQGLLRYPCDYDMVLAFFKKNLSPVQFRCGIGIGETSIHDFELTVNQLDGPSFYKARQAIVLAKKHVHSLVLIK
ncbi:MAG TPA: SatD family protein [Bacillota bacterium]|nr:SatD family protein [Bacillota bacterium]